MEQIQIAEKLKVVEFVEGCELVIQSFQNKKVFIPIFIFLGRLGREEVMPVATYDFVIN